VEEAFTSHLCSYLIRPFRHLDMWPEDEDDNEDEDDDDDDDDNLETLHP
jgi:hypothetical protein